MVRMEFQIGHSVMTKLLFILLLLFGCESPTKSEENTFDIIGSWQRDIPPSNIWDATIGIMTFNEDSTLSFVIVSEGNYEILGTYIIDSSINRITVIDDECLPSTLEGIYDYNSSETELTLTLVSDECGEDRAFFIANQSTAVWGRITND